MLTSAETAVLNALCTCLPIFAFASPATIFLSVFCPPRRAQTQDVGRKLNIEANQGIVHDAPSPLIETPPLALTTQMVSCYLFAIYAYHFEMWILFIPNSIGFILGLLWSSLYPLKASRDLGFLNQWKINILHHHSLRLSVH
jgi:hypothetical protein